MYVMHYMYVRWNLWPFTSLHDISELHLIHWITSHIALALARRWFCTYCRRLIQCKPLNIWLIQLLPPSFIEVLSRGSTSSDMKKVLHELIFVIVVVVVVVVVVVFVVVVVVVVILLIWKVSFTWSFNNSLTSSLLPTNSYTQEAGTSTIT